MVHPELKSLLFEWLCLLRMRLSKFSIYIFCFNNCCVNNSDLMYCFAPWFTFAFSVSINHERRNVCVPILLCNYLTSHLIVHFKNTNVIFITHLDKRLHTQLYKQDCSIIKFSGFNLSAINVPKMAIFVTDTVWEI